MKGPRLLSSPWLRTNNGTGDIRFARRPVGRSVDSFEDGTCSLCVFVRNHGRESHSDEEMNKGRMTWVNDDCSVADGGAMSPENSDQSLVDIAKPHGIVCVVSPQVDRTFPLVAIADTVRFDLSNNFYLFPEDSRKRQQFNSISNSVRRLPVDGPATHLRHDSFFWQLNCPRLADG